MMKQRGRHLVIGADVELLHLSRLQFVDFDQARQLGHCRVREGAGRIRLQRNSRRGKRPRFSQAIYDCRGIVGASESMEEPAVRFQDLLRRRPTQSDKFSRQEPAFCGMPGLKRLGHGAKVFSKSPRLTGNQAKCIQYLRML